jgi:hypothetical protein
MSTSQDTLRELNFFENIFDNQTFVINKYKFQNFIKFLTIIYN